MKPIDRLRHLLETHGIYRQAVKLLREHLEQSTVSETPKGQPRGLSPFYKAGSGPSSAKKRPARGLRAKRRDDRDEPRDHPRDQLDDPWNEPGAPFRGGDY